MDSYIEPHLLELKNANNLLLVSVNIRSINANFDKFLELANDIKGNTTIFCLQEIWELDNGTNYTLPNYHKILYKSRAEIGQRGGGVAFLIPKHVVYTQKNSFFTPNGEAISIEVTHEGKKVSITNVYRRPKSNVDEFILLLKQHLQNVPNECNSFVVGDFNINAEHNNVSYSKLEECMFDNYYTQLVKQPTRITETSSTIIDHIWQKCVPDYILQVKILTDSVADHMHPCIELAFKRPKSTEFITYRDYSKANIDTLNNLLFQVDWNEKVIEKDLEVAMGNLTYTLNDLLNKACPQVTRRIDPKRDCIQPWFTKAMLNSRRTKNKLIRKAVKSKSANDIATKNAYISVYNNLIIEAKEKYYRNEILKAKGNSKLLWDNFKKITRKFGKVKEEISCIKVNNKKITNPQEIANHVNTYFTNVAPNLTKNINPSKNAADFLLATNESIFKFKSVSQGKLAKVINSLKPKKSCGIDNLSNSLLKKIYEPLLHPLNSIINRSLMNGYVPKHMKVAKVIPILKKGDPTDMNNLRPISLLSSFSKIVEKIVDEQLRSFLEENDLLDKHQYGFRSGHSTEHAITDMINFITEEIQKNNKIAAIFIDVKKAFDSCNHTVLLKKLENMGIRRTELKWFESYLKERVQCTQVESCRSDILDITCGVPQGSILGPLLFIIYIFDLSQYSKFFKVFFADDTTLLISAPTLNELITEIRSELPKISEWFESNYLVLHPDKTKIMYFNLKPKDIPGKIAINNKDIEIVGKGQEEESFKLLGIHLDDKLSWKHHANQVVTKIKKGTNLLFCAKRFINVKTRIMLYQALIESHLRYCLPVWGPANKEYRPLILSQKVALRTIPNQYSIHTENIMKDHSLLSFKDMVDMSLSVIAYKILHKKVPVQLQTFIKWSGSSETRRGVVTILPKFKKTVLQKQQVFQMSKVWNSLRLVQKKILSEKSFKKQAAEEKISRYNRVVRCSNRGCHQCY